MSDQAYVVHEKGIGSHSVFLIVGVFSDDYSALKLSVEPRIEELKSRGVYVKRVPRDPQLGFLYESQDRKTIIKVDRFRIRTCRR